MTTRSNNPSQRAAVERIVREVLSELRNGRTQHPTSQKAQGTPSLDKPAAGTSSTLTVTSKVVTAAALDGRLSGVSQLIVPRGAVFTPAARDELKRHGVSIASAVASSRGHRLSLGVAETKYNVAPLVSLLSGEGVEIDQQAGGPLPRLVADLAVVAGRGQALIITDRGAVATCLANRQPGVRAALCATRAAIDAAVSTLGPNLLVLEPTGRGVFELQQLVRHWLRHGAPVCPAELQQHLN